MANYKIIGGDGKEYGPIDSSQLQQWISEGRLNAQSMIQPEGSTEWKPLSSFPEFGLQIFSGAAPAAIAAKPPASIKVFGIINIIFGSLGLLCLPFAFLGMSFAAKQPGYQPQMSPAWTTISIVLGIIGSAITLTSGIGLCRMKSWARKLAVYYSWFSLAFSIVSIAIQQQTTDPSAPEQVKMIGMISLVVGTLISWIYNGLLIYFLTRPAAKRALGEEA